MTLEIFARKSSAHHESIDELAWLYADEAVQNYEIHRRQDHPNGRFIFNLALKVRARQAIRAAIELANPQMLRTWLCDCLEEAMPIYEQRFYDGHLRRALQVARTYAAGECTDPQLRQARIWAFDAEQEAREIALEHRQRHERDDLFFHRESQLLTQAARVAMAVSLVTGPREVFSRGAPDTDDILNCIGHISDALSMMEFLQSKQGPLIRRSLYSQLYEETTGRITEQQAMKLASRLGRQGTLDEVLSELSRHHRLELHEKHKKKRHQERLESYLHHLRDQGDVPSLDGHIASSEETSRVELARDPDTSPEQLLALAREYPLQVERNPALPKIIFECPVIGFRIKEAIREQSDNNKLAHALTLATRLELTTWACMCAERGIRWHSHRIALQDLLYAALRCARREQSNQELRSHKEQVKSLLKTTSAHGFKAVLLAVDTALTGSAENARLCAAAALRAARDTQIESFWQRAALQEVQRNKPQENPKALLA